MFFASVNLNEMVMCLEDLINYFAQPEEEMGKVFVLKSIYTSFMDDIYFILFLFNRARRKTK